jgi:hypothetical protein
MCESNNKSCTKRCHNISKPVAGLLLILFVITLLQLDIMPNFTLINGVKADVPVNYAKVNYAELVDGKITHLPKCSLLNSININQEVVKFTTEEKPVEIDTQNTRRIWNNLSKAYLTEDQIRLLQLAYDIGSDDDQAELLQAILMQETIAGKLNRVADIRQPVGKRSYGVAMIKVSAARDVLRMHPYLGKFKTDEELIAELLTNDRFNLTIASKFLLHLRKQTKTVEHALVAYNLGLKASCEKKNHSKYRYAVKVMRYKNAVVAKFNKVMGNNSTDHIMLSINK